MQDKIERVITINASKERVYEMITNPEKVVLWFPDSIEGVYKVVGHPVFVFKGHGKAQVHVIEAKPYEYFSYRWIPGSSVFVGDTSTEGTTLVEFKIEEQQPGICTVTLTESGFTNISADHAEKAFKQNSGGWDFMLARLGKQFSK